MESQIEQLLQQNNSVVYLPSSAKVMLANQLNFMSVDVFPGGKFHMLLWDVLNITVVLY
jgi:hypothetical protein